MHPPVSSDLRRMLAEALATAEREYRAAQLALKTDPSDAARARYAKAQSNCREVEKLLKLAGGPRPTKQLQDYVFSRGTKLKS